MLYQQQYVAFYTQVILVFKEQFTIKLKGENLGQRNGVDMHRIPAFLEQFLKIEI